MLASSPPPPPPPLSPLLLATDGAMLSIYSLSASLSDLLSSGDLDLGLPIATLQDLVDIATALDRAAAVAVAWLLAAVFTGACAVDWLVLPAEEQQRSAFGLRGVLPAWALAWPLGEALKYVSAIGIADVAVDLGLRTASDSILPELDALLLVRDGVTLLLFVLVWRRLLLSWAGRY